MDNQLIKKYEKLLQILKDMGNCLVAYSGGVDSTMLLYSAQEALGNNTLGIIIDSPFLSKREKQKALENANTFNFNLMKEEIDLLSLPSIKKNNRDRCYFCKKVFFETICAIADKKGYSFVVEGSNVDDQFEFRPGKKALQELGIVSPLLEVGFTKQEIRQISHWKGLPTWNQPSFSCLATRIPYGTSITLTRLLRVETAESFLLEMGFKQIRVRDHYPVARIEIFPSNLHQIYIDDFRQRIVSGLKSCGYRWITLDLEGLQNGNTNEKPKTRNKK